jgi:stage V sporulation protein SpoVS
VSNPDAQRHAMSNPDSASSYPPILATAIAALGTDYKKAEVCATVAIAIELHRLADLLQRYYDEETGLG